MYSCGMAEGGICCTAGVACTYTCAGGCRAISTSTLTKGKRNALTNTATGTSADTEGGSDSVRNMRPSGEGPSRLAGDGSATGCPAAGTVRSAVRSRPGISCRSDEVVHVDEQQPPGHFKSAGEDQARNSGRRRRNVQEEEESEGNSYTKDSNKLVHPRGPRNNSNNHASNHEQKGENQKPSMLP